MNISRNFRSKNSVWGLSLSYLFDRSSIILPCFCCRLSRFRRRRARALCKQFAMTAVVVCPAGKPSFSYTLRSRNTRLDNAFVLISSIFGQTTPAITGSKRFSLFIINRATKIHKMTLVRSHCVALVVGMRFFDFARYNIDWDLWSNSFPLALPRVFAFGLKLCSGSWREW